MSQALKEHYDFLFKVILVGEGESTKTGLLWALTGSNEIISDYKTTIGVNFGIASVFIENPKNRIQSNIKLQIWDISCEPRAKVLRHLYYKGASGVIMVVKSLQEAQQLLKEIKPHNNRVPVLFILTDDPKKEFSHDNEFNNQLNTFTIRDGTEGIEWLAEMMLSCHKFKASPATALYIINQDLIKETLRNLHQFQLIKEQERLQIHRERRAEQIKFIKDVLSDMELPIEEDTVQILSGDIFFRINLINGVVEAFPLRCEECATACIKRKQNQLCIISASDGYAENLDKNSLLILSKIYAILTGELPQHVEDQIERIKRCLTYRPKQATLPEKSLN